MSLQLIQQYYAKIDKIIQFLVWGGVLGGCRGSLKCNWQSGNELGGQEMV